MNNQNVGTFLSAHYRGVMIGVGVVAVLCILVLIILGVSQINSPRTLVEISVAPSSAVVTIDDQDYRNGIYEFDSGEYSVEIAADGFTPKTMNIVVEDGQTTKISAFLLNKAEGMAYFERSAADINILRSLTDPEVVDFVKSYDRKLSIYDQLPINASYSLASVPGTDDENIYQQTIVDGNAEANCGGTLCLLVISPEPYENAVREMISDLGYDYDDYEVIYGS